MINTFIRRLNKIGIKIELIGNYPWVYLDKVNGEKVWGKYEADHGFTAFWIPVRSNQPIRISNASVVFAKIREMLTERQREYGVFFQGKELFYGNKDQCQRWKQDYERDYSFMIKKLQK